MFSIVTSGVATATSMPNNATNVNTDIIITIEPLEPETARNISQYLESHFNTEQLDRLASALHLNTEVASLTALPLTATFTNPTLVNTIVEYATKTKRVTDLLKITLSEQPDYRLEQVYQHLTRTKADEYFKRALLALANKDSVAKALTYLELALPLHQAIRNQHGEVLDLTNLGRVHNILGNSEKALEHYTLALAIVRMRSDKSSEAQILLNMGNLHLELKDTTLALEYYQQALHLYQSLGDKNDEAVALGNLGWAYLELGQPTKAQAYHAQAVEAMRDKGKQAKVPTSGNNNINGNKTGK
jgi:tetratricopeptide (TPR) repeat protein